MPGQSEATHPAGHFGLAGMGKRAASRAIVLTLLRSVLSATLLIAAYYSLPMRADSWSGIVVRVMIVFIALIAMVVWQVRSILHAQLPQLRAVDALVTSVTLMIVVFAAAYGSMAWRDPSAFTEPLDRTDGLYFTVTTLATVGYGDIAPVSEAARIAVMIQMVFNIAVIGVTVRLIVRTARNRLTVRS